VKQNGRWEFFTARRTCSRRLHHAPRVALFGFRGGVDAGAL